MDRNKRNPADLPKSANHPSLPPRRPSATVDPLLRGHSFAELKAIPTEFLVQWYKDLDRLFGMPMPLEIETLVYRGK